MTRPTIESLELAPFIKEALGELGFSRLTPVQEAVIPYALKGRNLIVQSQSFYLMKDSSCSSSVMPPKTTMMTSPTHCMVGKGLLLTTGRLLWPP